LANSPLQERLRAFVTAAADSEASEVEWLEALVVVIADRPLRTWTDDDAVAFEGQVADLARRFTSLEAIYAASTHLQLLQGSGAEVRRITLTGPDGSDQSRVVWIPEEGRSVLAARVADIAERLESLSRPQREAILALLAETVLAEKTREVHASTASPARYAPLPHRG
jgi:hypothetical protein